MQFLNTKISNMTFQEALEKINELIEKKEGGYIVTPNVDHIVRLEYDRDFKGAYEQASLVLTDGQPLIWISKFLKTPIKEKISGSDLFPKLCALAAERQYKVYLLGAADGVAAQAADNLTKMNPGLCIVGTFSPQYGFENDNRQVEEVWQKIHAVSPDILIVGLGTPKQELFLWKNQKELNGILAFCLGASIDFEAGKIKRAPRWMQRCGLEWFYRLYHEPRRLFKRYLIDDMKIIPIVWKYRKRKV